MKTVYFFLMLLFIFSINAYVFYRLVYMLPASLPVRGTVVAFGAVMMVCFFGSFFLKDLLPSGMLSVMYRVGTSWFFISLYFLLIFLIMEFLRVVNWAPIGNIMYKNWLSFGVVVSVVAVIFVIGHFNYKDKKRVELNLNVSKGTTLKHPLKIVALSDLHLGYSIGRKELAEWVDLINKEEADVVLMPGDIIDNDTRPLYEQGMDEELRRIKTKYGVYASMGNHEYITGLAESARFLESAGIQLLRDESKLIANRFYILGREDRTYFGRKPVWELTDSLNKSKPIIAMDHQPYNLEDVLPHGIDLQLSGHTHHGQIWPISWITNAMYEVSHGYLKKENTHFYVSSGMGLWGGKFRIGTQSEYVVINLDMGE